MKAAQVAPYQDKEIILINDDIKLLRYVTKKNGARIVEQLLAGNKTSMAVNLGQVSLRVSPESQPSQFLMYTRRGRTEIL